MSRELLARAWAAGAGPSDGSLTIDLDSTICETYGLAKEGARQHGYPAHPGSGTKIRSFVHLTHTESARTLPPGYP